jgi:hypothetical protein
LIRIFYQEPVILEFIFRSTLRQGKESEARIQTRKSGKEQEIRDIISGDQKYMTRKRN